MQLNTFDTVSFLRDYWQQKPLLVRNPWRKWDNPLAPDELAGLACEGDVESRLITETRKTWALEHGPLTEQRFATLGKKPWTLLVQAVDHFVPDVAALLKPFRFIPNWRIDDVMVSYAVDGGGVGPHYDQYDVFLIQGLGQRLWQLGSACDAQTPLLPHDSLRLLRDFIPTEEWVLNPGDMLYVPPRWAHNGVAVGDDCMTYSIGFRAPSSAELVADWSDDLCAAMSDDDRYTDPLLPLQSNPGEISDAALDRLHAMILEKMGDRDAFAEWFGSTSSTRKYQDFDYTPNTPLTVEQLREALRQGATLYHNPASRFSFIRRAPTSILLFVDGASFECPNEMITVAERLCAQSEINMDQALIASDRAMAMLTQLYNTGSLTFAHEDSAHS